MKQVGQTVTAQTNRKLLAAASAPHRGPGMAVIGAGAFARATLIPALKDAGAQLVATASTGGLTAADVAARFGLQRTAASVNEILGDAGSRPS